MDANHSAVCSEARSQGVDVVEILKPVDAIAHLAGYVSFIEIKVPGRTTWTRDQLKFISETRFPVAIVTTSSELMKAMRTRVSLSKTQKDAIAGFLALNKGVKWNGEQIKRVLNT